jgi:hypothetical protein
MVLVIFTADDLYILRGCQLELHITMKLRFFISLSLPIKWLPLFELCNGYNRIYNWFDILKNKYNITTTANTIMPNHVHCIFFFPTNEYNLNTLVSNGKRLNAYEIIKRLEAKGLREILLRLKEGLKDRITLLLSYNHSFLTSITLLTFVLQHR